MFARRFSIRWVVFCFSSCLLAGGTPTAASEASQIGRPQILLDPIECLALLERSGRVPDRHFTTIPALDDASSPA